MNFFAAIFELTSNLLFYHLLFFTAKSNRKRRLNSLEKRKHGLRNPHNLWLAEAMLQPSGARLIF
jgi:hypothetical protein